MSQDPSALPVSDPKVLLAALLRQALMAVLPQYAHLPLTLERPKVASHGDWASNIALQFARQIKRNPRELAQEIVREITPHPWVAKVEVAGPGFINFTLAPAAKNAVVPQVLARGVRYGAGESTGRRILVEFVSANPTGPLHVGHGRGAAYGAALSDVLAFAGHTVEREYYVNDAGRQMDILALSTWLRYLERFGIRVPFPSNAYQGRYVIDMAATIAERHGDRFARVRVEDVLEGTPGEPDPERTDPQAAEQRERHLDQLIANAKRLLGEDYAWIHEFALAEQLGDCRDDLAEFGVRFDRWFSEKSLYDTGMVERAVETLKQRGYLYEQDGAWWFRSTDFGDDKDRVVRRENGSYTYFASDIAYHWNKYERGYDLMIDIWGADHHGYIPRVRAAIQALGLDPEKFEVALVQFAVLYRNGEKVSMSTRAGEFVTLRQLRAEVGNDACRFFYVLRKCDQHLDFDLDLAKKQSNENPVYYVQYAHARICSVLREWGGTIEDLRETDASLLTSDAALDLCVRLQAFPEVVQTAASERAPHHIAFYLKDLAADFHAWYNAERILVEEEPLRLARLALAAAVKTVLATGLGLLGVSAPESM